jgi:RNA polymerase sigma factor (sigma-70 family)
VSDSDNQALDLLRRGNPRGFDALYAKYRDRIYAFLFRLTGQRDVADDLFQDTFLALASKGPTLWPDSNIGSWLFTVARHAFLDSARRRGLVTQTGHHLDGDRKPDELLSAPPTDGVTLAEIEQALLAVSLEDRQLLLLVGVEGMGQDEIARMMDIESGALRQRVVRARARLAAVLKQGGASPRAREHRT